MADAAPVYVAVPVHRSLTGKADLQPHLASVVGDQLRAIGYVADPILVEVDAGGAFVMYVATGRAVEDVQARAQRRLGTIANVILRA